MAVTRGTLHEALMRERLREATLLITDSAVQREQAVQAGRADVFMADVPYSQRMLETTEWSKVIAPATTYNVTQYAFAVRIGEDRWVERVNVFLRKTRSDGRLLEYARRNKLESIVLLD